MSDSYRGAEVYTTDGSMLGHVKEIRNDHFKVDAPMKPDYWLSNTCVRGGMIAGDRITVMFEKDNLNDHKVDLAD